MAVALTLAQMKVAVLRHSFRGKRAQNAATGAALGVLLAAGTVYLAFIDTRLLAAGYTVWLLGWMLTLQLAGALRRIFDGLGGLVGEGLGFALQGLALSLVWWATSWVLLFGRVPWRLLALGAALTGYLGVVYNRGSSLVMPPYVEAMRSKGVKALIWVGEPG